MIPNGVAEVDRLMPVFGYPKTRQNPISKLDLGAIGFVS